MLLLLVTGDSLIVPGLSRKMHRVEDNLMRPLQTSAELLFIAALTSVISTSTAVQNKDEFRMVLRKVDA